MEFENELFFGYKVNSSKMEKYGFVLVNDYYRGSFPLDVDNFRVDITITNDDITGKVIDETFGDEYILFRNNKAVGEFVSVIKEAYKKVLLDIRDNCYERVLFNDEQSCRIAQKVMQKYGDFLEFPWKKFPQFAIFRNRNNHRWYAVFMTVKDNALGENISGRSIVNIKSPAEQYEQLIKLENIFPGWHMDKKSWISVSLSDYFSDDFIESLIDMSYNKVNGKK